MHIGPQRSSDMDEHHINGHDKDILYELNTHILTITGRLHSSMFLHEVVQMHLKPLQAPHIYLKGITRCV